MAGLDTQPLPPGDRPTISVIVANYQGGPYIEQAIDSILRQSFSDLEVIVTDDASSDDSVTKVRAIQSRDSRVRLIQADKNGGPARSRNRALDAVRGRWIAIVDSDDIVHPERLERLLAVAEQSGADVVADDLLYFHEDGSPSRCLLPDSQSETFEVGPRDWILAGEGGTPALGYLKPVIRAALLDKLRYDVTLRIGEDYDLVLRLLLNGARFLVVPEPWYLYRRHRLSSSHRLSERDLQAMIDSQKRFVDAAGPIEPSLTEAFATRLRGLQTAWAFEQLVASIKRRDARRSLLAVMRRPALALRLLGSLSARVSRHTVSKPLEGAPRTLFLSDIPRAAVADADETSTILVPPYARHDGKPANGVERRKIWRQLADMSRLNGLNVVCDGPSGAYAAGFMPGDPRRTIIGDDATRSGIDLAVLT